MAMKILIVSDSHGNNRNLIHAVKNMSGTMDMMIHLGDMECSPDRIRELVDCPVEMVKGNCDYEYLIRQLMNIKEKYIAFGQC